MRFKNKVAIVTGAARGIGRGAAERLAQEGAKVVLVDLLEEGEQTAQEMRDSGHAAHFMKVDVVDRAQIDRAVARVVADHGPINVLVNNAGLVRATDFFDTTEKEVDELFTVNARGMFSFTQSVARTMVDAGTAGAIVNMSSITAAQGAPNLVAYSGTKGAVSAMTRSLAIALSEFGIRVNAVAPGTIATETAKEIHRRNPAFAQQILGRTPLRRMGTPEDVAATVAFLASEDASYFTGQVLFPEGGRLALSYTVEVDEDATFA